VGKSWRPPFPGNAAAYRLADTFSVLALATSRLVRSIRYIHFHHGQVAVILAVVPATRLVRHQHFGTLMRVICGSCLFAATSLCRLEPDMLGDIPAPVGPIRTARTLERLAIQMADDVHMEPRSGGRPKRAMRTLEYLKRKNVAD